MGVYPSGNDEFVQEFFKRTLHNLDMYLNDHQHAKDRYPYDVTQIINSFLGLIVFLKDSSFLNHEKLEEFVTNHAPEVWNCTGGSNQPEDHCFTNYIKRLRNAISHRKINSIPDEKNLIVALNFKDGYNGGCFSATLIIKDILKLIHLLKDCIPVETNVDNING